MPPRLNQADQGQVHASVDLRERFKQQALEPGPESGNAEVSAGG
jgi:hypothetical protein